MKRRSWGIFIVSLLFVLIIRPASAQEVDISDEVWKPIMEDQGLAFSYIFYREADTRHNGVVIRIINTNNYDVSYEFTVIFRADGAEHEEFVEGTVEAGRMTTGDSEGLFWIPFEDERQIREVGLRGWQVQEIEQDST